MDTEKPDVELEKPSVIINEGATVVKEFISDFISENDESEDEALVLSPEGKLRLQNQYSTFTQEHSTQSFDKTVVRKYYYFCDEMHRVYNKSVRTILACKIITAILFLVFTGLLIYAGSIFGNKMLWFSIWVATIFIDVGTFIFVDYFKDSVKHKVLPYLDDIETLSFKRKSEDEDFEDTTDEEDDDENDT